jgi:hypothetical protein
MNWKMRDVKETLPVPMADLCQSMHVVSKHATVQACLVKVLVGQGMGWATSMHRHEEIYKAERAVERTLGAEGFEYRRQYTRNCSV